MADTIARAGLRIATSLARFLEEEALPGTGIEPAAFWRGLWELLQEPRSGLEVVCSHSSVWRSSRMEES